MSLRAIVLMNNRKAKIMETKPKHTHVKWRGGLYVVDPVAIAPIDEDGKVGGSEIIWFEGNPNPIGKDGITDKSGDFLDEVIIKNALDQTSLGPRINVGELKELFSFLGKPVNWVWIMLGLGILYGIIVGLMTGGIV
jgi:hypothetical protein